MKKTFSVKKFSGGVVTALLFSVLILFAARSSRYMQVFLDGISLWALCVLPSSLPFLFLTALLTKTGSVQRVSKAFTPLTKLLFSLSGVGGYCLFISFLCGYPVGAKTLADVEETGAIDRDQATKMSVLCSSSGPLFILGSVGGGMFENAKIGMILLCSHFFAIIISGMALRFYKPSRSCSPLPPTRKIDNLLYESMYSSVLSALCVGGFVAVFYTFAVLLSDYNLLFPLSALCTFFGMPEKSAAGFARGIVEMTGGCSLLAADPAPLNVALCAFLITFGGISILFQQICYLKKAKVKLGFFLPVKVLQALLAALLCFLLCLCFGI